ncbi:MAG: hypothetical protein U0990_04030, partial [Candidatus Nanopelagicales bacterium]|nr:hypothetical protein [Candidatus Nanopelagicales bacterium]
DFSLLAKVLGAAAVVAAPIWTFIKLWDKKADKKAMAEQFAAVTAEITIQRGHIAKLFDKISESESKSEERHRELLMYLVKKGE